MPNYYDKIINIGRRDWVDNNNNIIRTEQNFKVIIVKTDDLYFGSKRLIGYFRFGKIINATEETKIDSYVSEMKKVNINKYDISVETLKNNAKITSIKEDEDLDYIVNIKGNDNYLNTKDVTISTTIPDDLEIISSDATNTNNQTLTWNLPENQLSKIYLREKIVH